MEHILAIIVIAMAIKRFRRRADPEIFTMGDLMAAAGVVYVAGEFRLTARRRLQM